MPRKGVRDRQGERRHEGRYSGMKERYVAARKQRMPVERMEVGGEARRERRHTTYSTRGVSIG